MQTDILYTSYINAFKDSLVLFILQLKLIVCVNKPQNAKLNKFDVPQRCGVSFMESYQLAMKTSNNQTPYFDHNTVK